MSKLIILTGKTASGKDTIKDLILKSYPNIQRVTTTTSRSKRSGETDEVDYHFITEDQFMDKVNKGEFIEYVEYGGNFYGTTKHELLNKLNHHDSLWKIDPSRAGEIREFIKSAFPIQIAAELMKKVIVIYVTTADEVILERLRKRHLSEDEIEKRMNDDQKIWHDFKDKYDFVVENVPGKLTETVQKIIGIIESHKK